MSTGPKRFDTDQLALAFLSAMTCLVIGTIALLAEASFESRALGMVFALAFLLFAAVVIRSKS